MIGIGTNLLMDISICLLRENDLSTSDHIFRQAFGTFIGLPYPAEFGGDANYIQHRWQTEPTAAFAAFVDGELVGDNFAISWGNSKAA